MMNRNNIMITNAYQRGKTVYIYNERGAQSASIMVGTGKGSGLVGFTGQTVSIQQGVSIVTYNEKGYEVGSPIYTGNTSNSSDIPASASRASGGIMSRIKNVIILLIISELLHTCIF